MNEYFQLFVPPEGWPMEHVVVAPEDYKENVNGILEDMDIDGVFIVVEFKGRVYPETGEPIETNTMLVKYDRAKKEITDSAKFKMNIKEALDFADYCRFKPLHLQVELYHEVNWINGGDRERWVHECYAPGGPGMIAAKEEFKRNARAMAAKEESKRNKRPRVE